MNTLKEFIKATLQLTPSDIDLLCQYDIVILDGETINFKDVLARFNTKSCLKCKRLEVLEADLKTKNIESPSTVQLLMKQFFNNNYRPTPSRGYSRQKFFNEISNFLEQTHNIYIFNSSDDSYREFLHNIVGDTSRNHKKLQIHRI